MAELVSTSTSKDAANCLAMFLFGYDNCTTYPIIKVLIPFLHLFCLSVAVFRFPDLYVFVP